jgi:acetyl esterase/lipase
MVTGHSLGGALAAVAATWLFDQLPRAGQAQDVTITPYTFAAPSVGNA